MDTNTTTYGPGTYLVHGELDAPDPRTRRRPAATWTVVVNPDGSGEQYAEDGTHMYSYAPAEDPAEVLRGWAELYRFPVEKVA